jgi:hypothetical protein
MHKFVKSRINTWRSEAKPDQLNFNYCWLEEAARWVSPAADVFIGFLSRYVHFTTAEWQANYMLQVSTNTVIMTLASQGLLLFSQRGAWDG